MQIAENERVEQQQSNMMQGAVYDQSVPSQSYDRNFIPVNILEPNHKYSREEQTALQLV